MASQILSMLRKVEDLLGRTILSEKVVSTALIFLALLLMCGGTYVFYTSSTDPNYLRQALAGFLSRGTGNQTIIEGTIVFIAYTMGLAGAYILYSTPRYLHEARYATILILSGTALLILSLSLLSIMYSAKTP